MRLYASDEHEQMPSEFSWLVGGQRERLVILFALGRQYWDDDVIREVARHICLDRMRTKEAVALIRLVEIVRLAEEEDVDMIVMGTHGRRGLTRMLMGSVAEAVVRRASCPVLTIKQPTKEKAEAS